MRRKTPIITIASFIMASFIAQQVCASGIRYLPDVTAEMSETSYWTENDDLLMTYKEIEELNALTISSKGTNMYDLKNQPETTDGIALNERIKNSSLADASYYLGWTYPGNEKLAEQADYDILIENTQNPNPLQEQPVKYAVAVRRTELRAFPSDIPIWDDPTDKECDYQYLTSIRVNEPLVITSVSSDGNYYLAKSISCSGWVAAADVALCTDKDEWLSAWDFSPEKMLVVYGDKLYTEMSLTGAQTSNLLLTMGTVLELADIENPNELIDNRAAYQNYAVWVPIRNEDGSYAKKLTLIPEHADVSAGYLPLTEKNIAKVAFGALGNTYGWGGALLSDDCSGYIRNVYKCFGMELARNTTWQSSMPMAKVNMTDMCREERLTVLDALPFGSILFFNGHEMLYLGKENGKYYVISATGNILEPKEGLNRQRIRSTIINMLDTRRANGVTWLDSLTVVNVPYWSLTSDNADSIPKQAWYHDAVAFCMKNNIMQGYQDNMFYPDEEITRCQLVKILWNLEGKPTAGETVTFIDVADDAWYADAVMWAVTENLIFGESNKTFLPDDTITREQLAAVLHRYAQYKEYDTTIGENTNILSYDDAYDISEYAIASVQYAVGSGLMKGKAENTLNPKDDVTRAETAQILYRFIESNN
ncbi:MAG: S-layer homology domain-containing protein [Eubacteriales bacterium]|nr:S-layer homology domain-containing protein [Eubacteriales bacterium]